MMNHYRGVVLLGLFFFCSYTDAQQTVAVEHINTIRPGLYIEVVYTYRGQEVRARGYVQSVKADVFTILDTQLKTIRFADVVSYQSGRRNKVKMRKPPLKSGKVFAEFCIGTAMGFGSAVIAGGIADSPGNLGAPFLAASVAYTAGSAVGVYLVGSSGGESGSFTMTLLGGSMGFLFGGLNYTKIGLPAVLISAPLGAVIGFNATRRYKTPKWLGASLDRIRIGLSYRRRGRPVFLALYGF